MDAIEPVAVPEEQVDSSEVVTAPFSARATVGYSVVVGIISVVAQVLFIIIWAVADGLIHGSSGMDIAKDGNCIFGAGLFSYPFVFGATYLIVHSRRGLSFWSYIGWHGWRRLKGKALLPWFGVLIGSVILNGVLMTLTGRTGSDVMLELLKTTNHYLIIVMLVFGAPLIEELFFRGFMFKGLENSRVGGVGAVLITSLIWVLIHGGQYNLTEMGYLMVLGVLFGYARLKTGSLPLSIGLHVVNNLIAVVSMLLWGLN